MLDIRLASALFSAIAPTSQVILIGDVDQLPSVGPGSVLRDLIESSVIPFKKLDKVFRQAATSKIISTAHKINQGESPEFDNSIESEIFEIDLLKISYGEVLDDCEYIIKSSNRSFFSVWNYCE